MKIKAAVCREFAKPLSIEEVALAAPGAGEIRVKVAACAICHSDVHYAGGAWGGDLPSVYGHETSGTVVNTARVEAGSKVVVIGTGGVGLNNIQGAALSDCAMIIAMDISNQKLAAAKRFGATHGFNSSREDATGAVRALTDGRGADYVFVTVGVKSVAEQAFGLIRNGGTLVFVGMPASGETAAFEFLRVANDCLVILGSKMGSSRIRVDIPKLVDLYQRGSLELDAPISGRYSPEEINEAIASVERGEALRNVIVF